MTTMDLTGFARDLALDTKAFVVDYVAKTLATFTDRLTAVETKMALVKDGPMGPQGEKGESVQGPPGQPGRDGKDADPEQIKTYVVAAVTALDLGGLVREEIAKAMAAVQAPRDGRDGKDVDMAAVATLVDAAMTKAFALIPNQIAAAVDAIPRPKDGQSVTVEDVRPLIVAETQKAAALIPAGKDGTSVDPAVVDVMVKTFVERAVAEIPKPKDGQSVTLSDVAPLIAAEVSQAVATIPAGRDGKDADPIDPAFVEDLVTKAVGSLPRPKDGTSVTFDDVRPWLTEELAKAVDALPKPKDAISIVDALVNREGHLVLTLSDGQTKDVGGIVGRDVDMSIVTKQIADTLDQWPRPKDGAAGKDGLGFDHAGLTYRDGDGFFLELRRGDEVKAFHLPLFWYAGTFEQGHVYKQGSVVTKRGSAWCAMSDTAETPGDGKTAWRLIVKGYVKGDA